ncbi:MAG TPA: hypothetical protein VFU55_12460 [Terracidiphilus sp.]|nr:hypothetical protein [Terracidiphilus sp.]
MVRSKLSRFALFAALVGLLASTATMAQDGHRRGRKFKAPPPTSTVTVTVVRKDDGKIIENASVIWHLVGDKGGMELHTNEEGKSMIDILPTGSKVILQILAHGYQTYGQAYTISKPTMAIKVELRRPVGQYTIYGHRDENVQGKSPIAVGHSNASKTSASGKDGGKTGADAANKPAETAKKVAPKKDKDQAKSAQKSSSPESASKDSGTAPAPQN